MNSTISGSLSIPQKLTRWGETHLKWLLIISIIVIMGVHFLSLTTYPPAFIDEGWLANTSWDWLNTGIAFDRIHAGVLDQYGHEWVTENFLGQLPFLIAYRFLGLGLWQTRFVAWLFGCILLFATVQVGRRLYSLNTGLFAALVLSLSVSFLESSRIRQDIILATMIMVAFWLALYALKEDRPWAHFLAGFIVAVGFDVQQTAIVFIPPLAVLYVAAYGKQILSKRGTWIVGIGGALGLAYYVVTHMLPNYEVYSKLMSFYFVSDAEARIPITNPEILIESAVRELARYRFRNNPFDFVMIVLGGLFLLRRCSKSDQLLLIFTAGAFTSSILLSSNKTNLYAINTYPFFTLITASGFLGAFQRGQSKPIRLIAAVLMALFVSYGVIQLSVRLYMNRDYNYYAITNRIREVIPGDKRVMGMPTWWFGFTDYDYRSSLSMPYFRFFNDYNIQEALETIHPDYIIVDSTQLVTMVEEGQKLAQGMNVYSVPRQEFETFIESRGELVLEFSDPRHGAFLIYRVNWEQ